MGNYIILIRLLTINIMKSMNFILKNFIIWKVSLLEIGISDGSSLKMWLDLFPKAYIYGMDISLGYNGDRYKTIIGDQSNINDLNKVKNTILIENSNLFLIVDDGSHIP